MAITLARRTFVSGGGKREAAKVVRVARPRPPLPPPCARAVRIANEEQPAVSVGASAVATAARIARRGINKGERYLTRSRLNISAMQTASTVGCARANSARKCKTWEINAGMYSVCVQSRVPYRGCYNYISHDIKLSVVYRDHDTITYNRICAGLYTSGDINNIQTRSKLIPDSLLSAAPLSLSLSLSFFAIAASSGIILTFY